MNNLLFTYGTLLSEFTNEAAQKLHQNAMLLGKARCNARMYLIKNKYPGAVLSNNRFDWIEGEIWHLNDPGVLFIDLDQYEECSPHDPYPHEYQRIQTSVFIKNMALKVWFYEYIGIFDPADQIKDHVFKEFK